MESYDGAGGTKAAPVRRAKVYHPMSHLDLARIDPSEWTLEDVGPTRTLEEIEAESRRPPARLRRLAKAPWWALERQLARRRSLRKRRERGWTDGDLWNLDIHLCRHLGSMLVAQVGEIRNHPPELEHGEWCAQVRRAGDALLAYDPYDAERVAEARSALRWVAENLVDLWD
ncbi:hypothetical protein EXE59_07860 [Nocardioides eburneiflavus]|uniref:Uncharacterized protein n=1 Tax=Nocardioides eburneiflavus TaxID=2518372 RepID=A0A4Z1CDL0_9ACTN|nr:hypothetical protein [Nocardioides eburneiflavus]TGN63875.1 hypothetical protein EXE59_07860 [Nocardioides eburneiflavus]